jgi:8-oxo-dGTP diphosphatase
MKILRPKPNMVNVFILDKDYSTLLINNIKHGTDRWEFPGGKVNEGESLEERAIKEAWEELGIVIKIKKVDNKKRLGDYETQTPEGTFLCRTYFAEIIRGVPKIMEPEKHGGFDYFKYLGLLKLNNSGILVPNLALALPELKRHMG